jgi:hypothetical protein
MALSDKERQQIIEEERLRWATRRTLMEDAWAQSSHGCGYGGAYRRRGLRLLFWLPVLALIAWHFSHGVCHF